MIKIFRKTPCGYLESFLIGTIIVITGYLLQYFQGPINLEPFKWPVNFIALVVSILIITSGSQFAKNSRIIKWISEPSTLISAFVFFTFQALMLGLFPQAHLQNIESYNQLGFNSVATSYPYILTQIYTLFVLGFNLIGVLQKKNKDLSLMIILGGFWIALASAQLGAFDVKKASVYLYETGSSEYGKGAKGEIVPLGFKITLRDFHMEEYPPEILVINPNAEGQDLIIEKMECRGGETVSLGDWTFIIEEYHPFAERDSSGFKTSDQDGALQAVKVSAENNTNGEKLSGWLSRGSRKRSAPGLKVNDSIALYLEKPKPRRFVSDIIIDGKDIQKEIKVEVNRPRSVKGWKIYQKGYDKEDGRWSKGSTLELVKDPWLPAVYLGIYIMIFGAAARLFRKERAERGDV